MIAGVDRVTVRRGGTIAVNGVSLDVPPGEVTAVVGGDGSGKTTLLQTLAGVLRPESGSVRRPAKNATGYMSAAPGVYRDLSVDENFAFTGTAYGLAGGELAARRDTLLRRTRLTAARGRLVGQLSGGMRQKLALALALVHRPELLILDEPTTGVDPVSRAELWRLIAQEVADGTAVLLSTSYLDEAERAATVCVLDRGGTLLAGRPDDILAAMPGSIAEVDAVTDRTHAWRRAGVWRKWSPGEWDGEGRPVTPDLEDAAIVAALSAARPAGEVA